RRRAVLLVRHAAAAGLRHLYRRRPPDPAPRRGHGGGGRRLHRARARAHVRADAARQRRRVRHPQPGPVAVVLRAHHPARAGSGDRGRPHPAGHQPLPRPAGLMSDASKPPAAPIQLFVPTFRIEECLAEIRECLEKGWTGLGFKTVQFEEAWKEYTGLPHAHFLNSATAGLHLAVRLLKDEGRWRDGDEVVPPPLTFVSPNHAILYEGLRPLFADVDEHLCLDPASVAERITDRTRAVMFVGTGGNTGQYERVVALCRERGLKLILDA